MSNKKGSLIILGLLILYYIISFSIVTSLKEILPEDYLFVGIDEDGETFDLRLAFAAFIGLPITYFVALGFNAWKNEWVEGDGVIRKIDEKFDIVSKLESEIKKQDNYKYEEERLLEKIKKAIERT